jgi:hypothetical protein
VDTALILNTREKSRPNQLLRTQAILSGVLLGLSFADLMITRFLVGNRIALKGNPLIREHIYANGFGLLKITGTLFALLIIADIFLALVQVLDRATESIVHIFSLSSTEALK